MLSYISIKDEKRFTVVLSELRDHFMKKPYGWKSNTISGLVATLYMSEDIKLRYQKTYLSSDPEEITKYLTRKENYDKVIIEIRKKTGLEIINNVKTVLRDLYDTNCLSEKETDLVKKTRDILELEKGILATLSAKYSEEARYPGKTEIDNYGRLLQDILGISDPSACLKMVSDKKDELYRLRKEAERPLTFFTTSQKDVFKRILGKIEYYKRNEQFLNDDAKMSLLEIQGIILSAEPYSEIKKFPQLEGKIESSLAASETALRNEHNDKAESFKKRLYTEFSSGNNYDGYVRECVIKTFDRSKKLVDTSNDCSYIKLEAGNLSNMYVKVCRQIEEEIKPKPEPEIKSGKKSEPVISLKVINISSFFETKNTIENEDDLDEYLRGIKDKLMEILKNKKIQVV